MKTPLGIVAFAIATPTSFPFVGRCVQLINFKRSTINDAFTRCINFAKDDERDYSYELVDSGNGQRLEKFGKYFIVRSCPTAKWRKALPDNIWHQLANLSYSGESGESYPPINYSIAH